ncbi:DUF551 domain-containing protein [Klebsiella pneumoniae]|uniref:DUF551 domain-containing protein n=1 Tax=Klebsiella pneumoniae TaxID=573 RepID=UPI00058E1027|nr:DUF551 domain-containing protein [Klebsiella pneumoniae]HDV1851605.1 DUF551 domain-containing protein [Escherichia coli]MBW6041610.1 DUF551 domain-containing protein [Klebsiella pneumoniae]MBW8668854.1 DUF551 domain-containing protein [Klebsiella pneumoniae subsp. pneumoniae]MCF6835710.1 DUF551 domain-containing protein [Klebsiella pneumoniae]MCF6903493.1 DUF551 domain-containing protein [Klebsiella pneumoniae]
MTKSTITRERLQEIAEDGFLKQGESKELARIALAAMDSEPDCKERKLFCSTDTARMRKAISVSAGTDVAQPYRHAQPALVIPDEMTAEQAYEIGYYYGDPVNVFARGANWMRQHIIDSTLAAAQHDTPALNSVQSVVTVPGKWIPVSERMPEVGDIVLTAMGGVVNVGETECSAANCRFFTSVISGRELPATHWMQLPAAPQEVGDA